MMNKFDLKLCQSLLDQTKSIEQTAELMAVECKNPTCISQQCKRWRERIRKSIENGEIKQGDS